jgi:carbon storage regulator CsrA
MLVLSRRLQETVVLPGLNVRVQVLDIKGGAVRLGIEAPPNVKVMRAELCGRPAAAPRPPRALLVEDNANERQLMAGFLRLRGFAVDTADDGVDALEYLRSGGKPDLVLLDMGLPRCDGPTALRAIRRDPSLAGLKVFAVSAARPEDYGSPAGVDRWFHKPVDPDRLFRDVSVELGWPAGRGQ